MKLNKFLILLFIFIIGRLQAADQKAVFDSANANYAKGNYEAAIRQYESILAAEKESFALYYNLGNAYYKKNNLGLAILNYERAKKLQPADEDISVNLKLADLKTEDKIEAAPQLFLTEWQNGLLDVLTEKEWSMLLITSITAGLCLFALYLLSGNYVLKQIGFFGGCALIVLSFAAFYMAKNKYSAAINNSSGIITSASAAVMAAPSEKGTKLFILHEGSKVKITEIQNEWTEIKIANGNVGWIKCAELQKI